MGRCQILAWACVATSLVACSFSAPSNTPPDGPGGDDVIDPDTPPVECADEAFDVCQPDGVTLQHCDGAGNTTLEACAWGCVAGGGPHCGVLHPAGGAAVAADTDPETLAGFGDATIDDDLDTVDGQFDDNEPAPGSFTVVGNTAIWRFHTLRLQSALVKGPRAVVLIADGEITVDEVALAQNCEEDPRQPGGGGFAGGDGATAPGAGGTAGGIAGAGGGGGANGGAGGTGGSGAQGGTAVADAAIATLVGGGGGGGGAGGVNHGRGGGGGGAIQLISNTRIVILSAGGINAGGCGGSAGTGNNDSGGGGGAGGTILLEAPVIEIAGGLAVNGGGGGGGGGGGSKAGGDGALSRTAVGGGDGDDGDGGDGAAGATLTGGVAGATGGIGGGGGGGIGRIRLNSRTNTVDADGDIQITGTLSPAPDDPNSTATTGVADVR